MTLPPYEGYVGGSRQDAKVVAMQKGDGYMHGDGDKVFSKDFSKTLSGATYARGR